MPSDVVKEDLAPAENHIVWNVCLIDKRSDMAKGATHLVLPQHRLDRTVDLSDARRQRNFLGTFVDHPNLRSCSCFKLRLIDVRPLLRSYQRHVQRRYATPVTPPPPSTSGEIGWKAAIKGS